jgi:hypothetical protein
VDCAGDDSRSIPRRIAMATAFEVMGERCDRIVADVLRRIVEEGSAGTFSRENK